jgi:hypothetical protein
MILIISGCIFQFDFFLKNAFGLYFFLLELFALSMIAMTFLISALVRKASASTTVGFLVFIIGYFLQLGAAVVYSEKANVNLRNFLALFSPTMLQVGLSALGDATMTDSYPGLSWSSVDDKSVTGGTMNFNQIYGWIILDFFIYLLLALYLDNTVPGTYRMDTNGDLLEIVLVILCRHGSCRG